MMMENNYKRDDGRYKQKNSLDTLVLDLSCKERVPLISSGLDELREEIKIREERERLNLFTSVSQTLSANANKHTYKETNLLDEDKRTPIGGSSAMLSPYSETNSPKRMKNESVDYYENSSQLKHATLTNMLPRDIIPGVTMMTPQHPSLFVLPNEATNIPLMMPTMPIPYMEATQSFMTNDEAKRKVPFTMSAECSTSMEMKLLTSPLDTVKKLQRPFKAYPKNLLSMVSTLDYNSNEEFTKFRRNLMDEMGKTPRNKSNPKMRRISKSPGLPTSTVNEKDAAYYERRRKNNEAAKRSRDARRAKEDELAIKAAFLEHENIQLKRDVRALKHELQKYTNYNFVC
ncbi:transcription factor VBP [Solenopsis invicta]|uniref:transcription factor VBP n=1 Tax=Solenopsis invicta TaxID=13686 RepID=UPI0001FEB9CB|nr:transcription factor VBP [Solenopsis invicta]